MIDTPPHIMADILTPATAPLPTCCARPIHSFNAGQATLRCVTCAATYTFANGAWIKPEPPTEPPAKKPK